MMARIILQNDSSNFDTGKKKTVTTGLISDRDILKKRTKKYLDLIANLDAKTLTDTKGMDELMKAVREEFGTAGLTSMPLGVISKCFLGVRGFHDLKVFWK